MSTAAPKRVGVRNIPTTALRPNPHNPRILFDRLPLETLRKSIERVGILVPLTVYWEHSRKSWVILDGERRWICARNLGLSEVPVNQVAEPDQVQNIVTMFQIHKLREDWELMPTALKLQVLMDALEEKRDAQLAELTGLDRAVVVRCKKLLAYPKKYQNMMLDLDPYKRVKADFFIELSAVLRDRNVRKMEWFKPDHFTQQMLHRYEQHRLAAVTDFRLVKQYITNAVRAGRERTISDRLREFADESSLPIEHLAIESGAVRAVVRRVTAAIQRLDVILRQMDVGAFYAEDSMWKQLDDLAQLIRAKLVEAERRPS